MAQLGGFNISFFVILLLHFTAITGQNHPVFTVRQGEEVILPCGNAIQNQAKCDSTTWLFAHYARRDSVELVDHGQVKKEFPKADRLRVTENCSLVIKNVTAEDVGRYYCQQYQSDGKQGADALVDLSVVTITEQQADEGVILTCYVWAYRGCDHHTVEWLYEGDTSDVDISTLSCSATAEYSTSGLNQKPNYSELLKCKVTDDRTEQVLLCGVGPGPSSVKPGFIPYIIVAVGLAALLIIVVAVIRWKKTKGTKTNKDVDNGQSVNPAVTRPDPETSHDTADPEEGVAYASVSYTKKTNSEAQVGGEDEAVTYASVNVPSSAAGASADPNALYATVNKPK